MGRLGQVEHDNGSAHPLSGDREQSHSDWDGAAVIECCKGLVRGHPRGSGTDLGISLFIPRTASALARCFVMIANASIWTSEAARRIESPVALRV